MSSMAATDSFKLRPLLAEIIETVTDSWVPVRRVAPVLLWGVHWQLWEEQTQQHHRWAQGDREIELSSLKTVTWHLERLPDLPLTIIRRLDRPDPLNRLLVAGRRPLDNLTLPCSNRTNGV